MTKFEKWWYFVVHPVFFVTVIAVTIWAHQ